jgi:hypothetical protein
MVRSTFRAVVWQKQLILGTVATEALASSQMRPRLGNLTI